MRPQFPAATDHEGFFAALTKRSLKRVGFVGVVDLQAAINRYVADQNTDRKPFRWKATPDKIIGAAARGHQTLDSIQLNIFVELHWFFVEL